MVKKKRQCEPGEQCDESTESCDESVTSTCPHLKKSIDLNKLKKALRQTGFSSECLECSKRPEAADPDYEQDLALWMCLRCGSQLCGRMKNKHALAHYETPRSDSHSLCLNTTSWDVFCYCCNNEVSPTSTKKLLEIVEYVKKQSSSAGSNCNTEYKSSEIIEIPKPPELDDGSLALKTCSSALLLRRVRGLSNLGNTCFFNSVMQCLVQTPYLTSVLQQMAQPGEKFELPGGKLKLVEAGQDGPEEREVDMPPICGELQEWGSLTETLASTLVELQTSGKSDVFTPSRLLNQLVTRMPQFGGGDQHDSHELLRHLLEAVRSEDLRRYQAIVLQKLGLSSREKRSEIDDEMKQKVKFYGQQASDTMLRPEQVFRGFLVSTLACQDCNHSSNRTEYFLDLSLPVTADKPQPPAIARRKGPSQEEQINCLGAPEDKPSKHQLKKEKQAQRKLRKNKKGHNSSGDKQSDPNQSEESKLDNKSSSEQSDADIEDNLEDTPKTCDNTISCAQPRPDTAANFAAYHMESGYNSEKVISSDSIRASPVDLENKEKSDASPERLDKDRDEMAGSSRYCLSATAIPLDYRPLSTADSPLPSNPDSGVASPETAKHTLSDTINVESPITSKELGSPTSLSSEINMDMSSPRQSNNSPINEDLERPMSRISFVEADSHMTCRNSLDGNILSNAVKKSAIMMAEKSEMKLENIHTELDRLKLNDDISRGAISKHMSLYSPGLTLNVNDSSMDNSSVFDLSAPRHTSPDLDSPKWRKEVPPFVNRATTISPRYQCDDGEFSVQSCLNQFTTSELLTGNNKVGCESCTKRLNTGKTVYTNATKRFLISSPPAVLILHLKRFQIGPRCMFRKMTKHVNFPIILDLAPFCSEQVKVLPNVSASQTKLLYSLYGVVEHSGSMHGGHYVAYVKVRPNITSGDKKWGFLPTGGNVSKDDTDVKAPELLVNGSVNGNDNDTDSSLSGYESGEAASGVADVEPSPGRWYNISDSRVQEVTEDKVLKAQAYLLFYERIL